MYGEFLGLWLEKKALRQIDGYELCGVDCALVKRLCSDAMFVVMELNGVAAGVKFCSVVR